MFDPISLLPQIIAGLLDVVIGVVKGKVDNATSIELKKAEKEIDLELSKLKHQQDLERLQYTQRHELQIKLLSLLDKIDAIQLSSPEQIAAVQKLMEVALSLPNKNYVERIEQLAPTMRNITPIVELPGLFLSLPTTHEQIISATTGIDYRPLKGLLKAEKWREADQETLKKMLEVVRRDKVDYLEEEDIDRFFCEGFRKIDQLWVKYSNGHFGFSVQKRIYQSLGGTRNYDQKIWQSFCSQVGWLEIMPNYNFTFALNAPPGHLPTYDYYRIGVSPMPGYSLLSHREL